MFSSLLLLSARWRCVWRACAPGSWLSLSSTSAFSTAGGGTAPEQNHIKPPQNRFTSSSSTSRRTTGKKIHWSSSNIRRVKHEITLTRWCLRWCCAIALKGPNAIIRGRETLFLLSFTPVVLSVVFVNDI